MHQLHNKINSMDINNINPNFLLTILITITIQNTRIVVEIGKVIISKKKIWIIKSV